jgi:hypothetical protein
MTVNYGSNSWPAALIILFGMGLTSTHVHADDHAHSDEVEITRGEMEPENLTSADHMRLQEVRGIRGRRKAIAF